MNKILQNSHFYFQKMQLNHNRIINLKFKIKDKSNRIFYDEVQDTCFNELGIKEYNDVEYLLNLTLVIELKHRN